MDALQADIQHLNEQLFLIAGEPTLGERALKLLEASPTVAQRVASASADAVGTAIRCGVPLVTFTSAVEELAILKPRDWRVGVASEVPMELQEFTRFALQFAQRLALLDSTVAQLHFGLTRMAAEGLTRLGVMHLLQMSRRHGVMLRLRLGDQLQVWDRLLIGERCRGPRAYRISQQAALLSLGMD